MLPLTIDLGPELSITSFAAMFGHPGISALEYAGSAQEAGRKTLSLRGKSTIPPTQEDKPKPTETPEVTLLDSQSPPVQELSSQQRRRGTFINHTPRDFEMRSPKRTEFPRSSDTSGRPQTSQGSSTGSKSTSWTQHRTHASIEDRTIVPAELDSKEVGHTSAANANAGAQAPTQVSTTSSLASKVGIPPSLSFATTRESGGTYSASISGYSHNTGKRRRRQTPFKISVPKGSMDSRHSPLEPWVARHRREATLSSIGSSPPKVSVEDIAEVSTFRAIQEYFDSQSSARSTKATNLHLSSKRPSGPLQSSPKPDNALPNALNEPAAIIPIVELGVPQEDAPDVPHRSPKRISSSSGLSIRTLSRSSSNEEFESAAQGQYSPYDAKMQNDALVIPRRRVPSHIRVGQAARAGSSTLGRMAPPILGHEGISASAALNDLSYYLKNTGPSPEPRRGQSRKSSFKMFKVKSKKSLAARVGSVEGSPKTRRTRSITPACARETTTSGGVKHLRIMIPSDKLVQDQTITLPISSLGSNQRSKHISITWTEEMMNPLASLPLENAISGFDFPDDGSASLTTPVRSPKRSPNALKTVPVEDHPLATREERARARKLRDLKRFKKRVKGAEEGDATAGALPMPDQSPTPVHNGFLMESVTGHDEEDDESRGRTALLKQRVVSLQRKNTELTDALARIVGFEAEDGDLDADAVLKAYRQIGTGSGDWGYGQRRGREFTT